MNDTLTPCADLTARSAEKAEWNEREIITAFTERQIPLTEEKAKKLCVFGSFLQEKNAEFNLTAITEKNEIIVKHFIDSALTAKFIPLGSRLCDVGCGAGFPSVVLKILREDLKVTCVDSVGKKVNFVRELTEKIGAECRTLHIRAEELAEKERESFDAVCARAVAALPTLLEYLAPLVRVGGKIIALKGKDGEQEKADAEYAGDVLGLCVAETASFSLDGDRRTIIVYDKVSPTPTKYPRGQNAPRKNPIVKKK